jgi:hypothetical protein
MNFKLTPAKLAAALAPFVVTGALMASTAAAAQPQQYIVHNESQSAVGFIAVDGFLDGTTSSLMPNASLESGGDQRFGVTYTGGDGNVEVATYAIFGGGHTMRARLAIAMVATPDGSPFVHCVTDGTLACSVSGNTVTIDDGA